MPARSEHVSGRRFPPPVRVVVFVFLLMLACPPLHAHEDLQFQIDDLSNQLAVDPDNVELLLRRGDLLRRHENWNLARADFERVRELQPGNETVDWYEGRLEVQAGQPDAGVRFLDRFLRLNPDHMIALQNRAQGYLLLHRPLLAAQDYQSVIRVSERPAPSLYSANAFALIRAGSGHFSAAKDVVLQGLTSFPAEVMLTALATDLCLAQSDTDTARRLMDALPVPILNLTQWQTRNALLQCQSGQAAMAAFWFSSVADSLPGPGNPQGLLSAAWLDRLAAEPTPENCRAAAIDSLHHLPD